MSITARLFGMVCGAGFLPLVAGAAGSYTLEDFAAVPKIDVHVHINSSDPALIEQAAADGFRLITINVDYPDFPPLPRQRALAAELTAAHPEILAWVASFEMRGWDEPGWQQRVLGELGTAFTDGAIGVKVWKNIGMQFRDRAGQLVMIDDPKFDPVFAFVRERGKVLVGHQGEPHNCWLPLAEMTVNNDREYFREHPQYHMFLHPELPSYKQQMAARDGMLARNPTLRFMGAHMASLEWSVDELARFLDSHANAVVDVAERLGQVQFQSNLDRDKVRRFFIRYPDRLLYASDLTQNPGADPQELRRKAHATWLRDWQYLNSDTSFSVPQLDFPVRGLALPREVIDKIYSGNAERWFGVAWKSRGAAAPPPVPAETGPEDVPADNRFDTGRMTSSLVVPHTDVSRFRFPVIDAHSHDVYAATPDGVADWVRLQTAVAVEQSFIFTGKSGAGFRAASERYALAYPGRFLMFAGFSAEGIDTPDYAQLLRARLREDIRAGAVGLGELTDKGLGLARVGERAYFIDDPRFDALWDEAGKLHVPVFVHIAEPAAFYEPADERNDLRRSVNWSLHGKGTPGFEAMLARFERVIARHPNTTFVAVHAFNLGNNLGRVGALLEKYPNVQVDFAARMWELARQPFTARRFFIKYADRILFGTDNDPTLAMYLAHVRQLETEDEWFWPADAEWWRGYGMNLPASVLHRIYRDNALRILGPHLKQH